VKKEPLLTLGIRKNARKRRHKKKRCPKGDMEKQNGRKDPRRTNQAREERLKYFVEENEILSTALKRAPKKSGE